MLDLILGTVHLPWWGYVVILAIFLQTTIFAVTIYLHRCQAHRAVDLHPIASHFFRFWLWLTTGTVTKEWTAIHRKHHARVETEDDPHSPQTRGIKKVFFEGAELYRAESKNLETLEKFGDGTPDDWIERHLYSPHSISGVVLMLLINMGLFGFIGLAMWAVQMSWIPFWAAGVVNGIGHYLGYRNFETGDASRNIFPVGWVMGGEELHNNHHAYATSAKFSVKWWEFDSGWYVICLMRLLGLAKPKRVVPRIQVAPAKSQVDAETLTAIITYRMQVMARYAREVVSPALREEKKRALKQSRHLLRHAKSVLIRDASLMKAAQSQRLAGLLENFQSLRVVYQFRLKLQSIWNQKTASQKELVEALQEWCRQAEATGIEALTRFSIRLKTYVPA